MKRFRNPEPSYDTIKNVLIVGSGTTSEIAAVYQRAHGRFGEDKIYDAIVPVECRESIQPSGELFVYSPSKKGARIDTIRFMRAKEYDIVVILGTGIVQYNRFKQFGIFASKAKKILIYNENMDSFYVDKDHREIVRSHLRWRKENRPNGLRYSGIRGFLAGAATPLKVLLLFSIGIMNYSSLKKLRSYVER